MTMSSDQLFPQRFLLPRLNKKRLTLSALFYGKRGKLVGANLQLFSDSSNNLRKTIVIIFNFLTNDSVAKCDTIHKLSKVHDGGGSAVHLNLQGSRLL